jgi:hypothetical protein
MDSPAYDDISLLLLMAQAKSEAWSHLYLYHHYYSLFVSLNHMIIVSVLLFNNTFL